MQSAPKHVPLVTAVEHRDAERHPAAAALALRARGGALAELAVADGGSAALIRATTVADESMREIYNMLVERAVTHARVNEDGLSITGEVDDLLGGFLVAAQRASDRRFAAGTRRWDSSYWRKWKEWCSRIGTPPLRTNAAVNSGVVAHLHEREVFIALGAFMAFVGETHSAKCKRCWRGSGVRPPSQQVGLIFVSLSTVVMAAEGLIQEHIDAHGADSLLPRSREPFTTEEILRLPHGTRVGPFMVGSNLVWQGVRVMIALYCTMGPRKEAIALDREEIVGPRKLSMWRATWRLRWLLYRAPALQVLLAIALRDLTLPVQERSQGSQVWEQSGSVGASSHSPHQPGARDGDL